MEYVRRVRTEHNALFGRIGIGFALTLYFIFLVAALSLNFKRALPLLLFTIFVVLLFIYDFYVKPYYKKRLALRAAAAENGDEEEKDVTCFCLSIPPRQLRYFRSFLPLILFIIMAIVVVVVGDVFHNPESLISALGRYWKCSISRKIDSQTQCMRHRIDT